MALLSLFKQPEQEPQGSIKETGSLMGKLRLTLDSSPLGANFRRYGPSFGAYDYDAFIALARAFYTEALHSDDPLYTVVEMPGHRIAIDYNGEKRGIYTHKGKPLAFFRPDYKQAGFKSKQEEIRAFQGELKSI